MRIVEFRFKWCTPSHGVCIEENILDFWIKLFYNYCKMSKSCEAQMPMLFQESQGLVVYEYVENYNLADTVFCKLKFKITNQNHKPHNKSILLLLATSHILIIWTSKCKS
jgi:hypothetical protein